MHAGEQTVQPETRLEVKYAAHSTNSAWRYAGVAGSVALAGLIRIPLQAVLGNKVAFITLFPAVVASAWMAGIGGGVLATVLCAIFAAYFIIPPHATILVANSRDQLSLFVFVIVGCAISLLGHARNLAQREAEVSIQREADSARSAHETADTLRESEARKAAILESALDCIITIDEHERVVEWNPSSERTFGYTRAEALGQELSALIIPERLRAAHKAGMAHYLRSGEGPVLNRRVEVPAVDSQGREFLVELTPIAIRLDGRTLFTAYLRDLTEREKSAAQQRDFLRDVLLSVTEGHLRLCHSASDLPGERLNHGPRVTLSRTGGCAELRNAAKAAADADGFSEERIYDLMTAVSEAAMNAAVHGGGGDGFVCCDDDTVQVWVQDHGTGIDVATLPQATLEKGFSSAGTLGHGIKIMLQTADRMWLLTGVTGTTVVLEQDRVAPPPSWLRGAGSL